MFCHSPESWKELWEKEVFGEGKVKVEAFLTEVQRQDLPDMIIDKRYIMVWSATRL